jgi:Domain of unknown function (DUF6438)
VRAPLLVLSVAMLCRCATPVAPAAPRPRVLSPTRLPPEAPRPTVLTLRRTRCFGVCPDYRVSVDATGGVVFDGVEYVATTGRSEWRVSEETASSLIARMRTLCAKGTCLEPRGCAALDIGNVGVRLTLPNGGWQAFANCPNETGAQNDFADEIDRLLQTSDRVTCDRWSLASQKVSGPAPDARGPACGPEVTLPKGSE